mmetsp:Transcript_21917/g.21101  ORF Transcript_21917/g.21101 Transcript_21917/m.21101 type:complete len:204 (+) Transcript_21917:134-745(+)
MFCAFLSSCFGTIFSAFSGVLYGFSTIFVEYTIYFWMGVKSGFFSCSRVLSVSTWCFLGDPTIDWFILREWFRKCFPSSGVTFCTILFPDRSLGMILYDWISQVFVSMERNLAFWSSSLEASSTFPKSNVLNDKSSTSSFATNYIVCWEVSRSSFSSNLSLRDCTLLSFSKLIPTKMLCSTSSFFTSSSIFLEDWRVRFLTSF